uniref:Uncharacterized protein n=1 Tax=Aplanochytrium stocchinoi TaxID=215587 RepID=A0A7S3PKQ2_9STRA|mmetsp:Transcript_22078/g.26935  ORF Transcript_22078/g.26935 Transcript_22078/m.26935 type:complete len:166 (-) Transcript_22078:890-1387(-)
MAEPKNDYIVAKVFTYSGGSFDDESTRPLAIKVMRLALAVALVYVAGTIVDLSSTEYKDAYVELSLNQSETFGNEQTWTIIYYVSPVVGLLCGLMLPFCGYYGAKNNDQSLLTTFCCISGCCAVSSFAGFIGAIVVIGEYGGYTCAILEDEGLNPVPCQIRVRFR